MMRREEAASKDRTPAVYSMRRADVCSNNLSVTPYARSTARDSGDVVIKPPPAAAAAAAFSSSITAAEPHQHDTDISLLAVCR